MNLGRTSLQNNSGSVADWLNFAIRCLQRPRPVHAILWFDGRTSAVVLWSIAVGGTIFTYWLTAVVSWHILFLPNYSFAVVRIAVAKNTKIARDWKLSIQVQVQVHELPRT